MRLCLFSLYLSLGTKSHSKYRLSGFRFSVISCRISSSMRSPTAITRLRVVVWVVPPIGGRSIRSRSAALRYESCAPRLTCRCRNSGVTRPERASEIGLQTCVSQPHYDVPAHVSSCWSHAPANHKGGISVKTPRFFPVPDKRQHPLPFISGISSRDRSLAFH